MPLCKFGLGAVLLLSVLSGCTSGRKDTSAPSGSSEEGLRLLHRLQDALGGAERIAAVSDYEESIRAEAWDARGTALGSVRKRTRWLRTPNVIRLDQVGPRGTYVLFFDGSTGAGWEILPDLTDADPFKTVGKSVALAGGELQFARGYLFGFELNQWLADRLPGYAVTAPGVGVLRIRHGADATDFTIGPVTNLPVKSAGVSLADPDHPVPSEMHYETWTEVSGIRFPTHRVNYLSKLKRGEVTVAEIRVNSGLRRETLAAPPADFSPDMERSTAQETPLPAVYPAAVAQGSPRAPLVSNRLPSSRLFRYEESRAVHTGDAMGAARPMPRSRGARGVAPRDTAVARSVSPWACRIN